MNTIFSSKIICGQHVCDHKGKKGLIQMGFRTEVTRTPFFKELSPTKQKEYLSLKREKVLPSIDNLYFSVFVNGDKKVLSKLDGLSRFLERLEQVKNDVIISNEPIPFGDGLFTYPLWVKAAEDASSPWG